MKYWHIKETVRQQEEGLLQESLSGLSYAPFRLSCHSCIGGWAIGTSFVSSTTSLQIFLKAIFLSIINPSYSWPYLTLWIRDMTIIWFIWSTSNIYIRSTRGTMPWLGRQATVQLLLKGRCDERQSWFLCQGLQDLDCATKKVYFSSSVSTVTFLGVFLYLGLTQNMKCRSLLRQVALQCGRKELSMTYNKIV